MSLAKGDMVMVAGIVDARDVFCGGEPKTTFKFVGRVGRIVDVLTGGNVGESVDDPFYIVEVPVLGRDGFFTEELRRLA